MKATFNNRQFQFWYYRVSHGELLVRSPRDRSHPLNIDVCFAGVEYVELPRLLPEMQVDEPCDDDLERLGRRFAKLIRRDNVTVLESLGQRYLVVAAAAKIVENELDIFDLPFD